jgi:dTDP-glucose 4,6-dehydratase
MSSSKPVGPLPIADLAHILDHTRDCWDCARGKAFFITGGTGFFGIWLLESFAHINDTLALGMSATVLTRDPNAFAIKAPHLTSRSDLRFVRGDIRSFEFSRDEFEYIIHAATEVRSGHIAADAAETFDCIVTGTQRVLEFAKICKVQKLLLVSSGAVYGKQPSELSHIPEDYPGAPDQLRPESAYGEGKRASEHICQVSSLKNGFELKIARCFAFVGPHLPLNSTYAIGNFIRDALNGQKITVLGDGVPLRSYLYASDLMIWLWTILFQGAAGRAYNVGSDERIAISDLAHLISKELHSDGLVEISSLCHPHMSAPAYVPSIKRAREELKLVPRISLRESLASTAAWYRCFDL